MKFSLIFEHSNDSIEFDVVNNGDILCHFVKLSDKKHCNAFTDNGAVARNVDQCLNDLHNNLTLTNSVLGDLGLTKFAEKHSRLDYLDQMFLNRQHEQWAHSQQTVLDIDQLRYSEDQRRSKIGWRLHDLYPDDIRKIKLAETMIKLGYIYPYEEVNLTVHRLEQYFATDIEYKADLKWDVYDNVHHSSMSSTNDVVNFSFGYTYVGRQYYNKWQFYDTELFCQDHYNYETLEHAFQINLDRPQTIPFSKEFLSWCDLKQVPPIATQLPIANAVDIDKNLTHYRTVLYTNSRSGHKASISIH